MLGGIFEKNNIKDKIQTFDKKIAESNFWKDKLSAQKILKEKKFLENIFNNFSFVVNELENLEELLELASKENDTVVLKDCREKLNLLHNQIKKTEVQCFLSGENDHLDAYLEIHAGAGALRQPHHAAKRKVFHRLGMDQMDVVPIPVTSLLGQ